MSVNWSSGWLTCNMGCSAESLMKLIPVNGTNMCEVVFVVQRWTFSSLFFKFQPIYQVGGLQWVSATSTTVIFWQCRLLHKLHGVCRQIIVSTFLHYLHSVIHMLHKNLVNQQRDFFVALVIQLLLGCLKFHIKPTNYDCTSKSSAVTFYFWNFAR